MSQVKFKNPLLRLFYDSKLQWPGFIAILLFSLLAGVFKTISAALWGKVVDLGTRGEMNTMFITALLMLLFIFLDALRTAVHYKIIGNTTEKMFLSFRMRAFSVLTRGDVAVLEGRMRSGDVAMRVNSDTEQLCNIIAAGYSHYSRLVFQAVFAIMVCIILSWQLSIAYFILLPLSLWLFKKVSLPIQSQKKAALNSTGKAMSLAVDILSGLPTVKSFNIQSEMNAIFGKAVDAAYEQTLNTEKIGVMMTVIKYTVSVVQLMTLLLMGSLLVTRGMITIGNVMSFVALSAYVTEAFGLIDAMTRSVRDSMALSQRLYEIYDIPLEIEGEEEKHDFSGDYVQMRNMCFAYSEENKILEGVNLALKENQKIAIIGPSGCGKSTIIKLICRFYNPLSGELRLFGSKSENINLRSLRRELALVSQDAVIFDGSIYENVLYGRIDASEKEVIKALKDANLWDFVSKLPQGVHTHVGEFGNQLSGGQRQRIAIARAILKNPRLLLLDEATSALDTHSEYEIQKSLDNLLEERAAIIVAHRLTTVQNVDYIYCLDGGRVLEQGTPADLLAKKGYYYSMCVQQGIVVEGGAGQ